MSNVARGLDGTTWDNAVLREARRRLDRQDWPLSLDNWRLQTAEAGAAVASTLTLTWPGDGQVSLHTTVGFPWWDAVPGWHDSAWRDALALEALAPVLACLAIHLPAMQSTPKLFWHAPQFFREHIGFSVTPLTEGPAQRLSLRWRSDSTAADQLANWARRVAREQADPDDADEDGACFSGSDDNAPEPLPSSHSPWSVRALVGHVTLSAHEWEALRCGCGVLMDSPVIGPGRAVLQASSGEGSWVPVGDSSVPEDGHARQGTWWLSDSGGASIRVPHGDELTVWTLPSAVDVQALAAAWVSGETALSWAMPERAVYALERGGRHLGRGRLHDRPDGQVLEITEWLA